MKIRMTQCIVLCAFFTVVCLQGGAGSGEKLTGVFRQPFGQTPDGQEVHVFTLQNDNGLQARVINYGAMLISLRVPDRNSRFDDIVLGFDTLGEYLNRNFGGTTGRFANRIGNARFTLDGIEYKVTPNAGQHHIHGGRKGFSQALWKATGFAEGSRAGVRMAYRSKDGEEGYPGNLNCTVTYWLSNENELAIEYEATTDKPTVLNLTNHGYYNLAGAGSGNVHDHLLQIFAGRYTVADSALIPTGQIQPVRDTPLDFTTPRTIGSRIEQLTQTRGYDHNYVFDDWDGSCVLRVRIVEPTSGRVMEVFTSE
ncbi:MAG: galactose mutarotase, partial [Sedimentisphaerales bacterium]|nr:galactose mutarotase [Sedimentisphaerales bacterium]